MIDLIIGGSQDEFSYFQDEWTSYKRSCGITDETATRDQLRAACNEIYNILLEFAANLYSRGLMEWDRLQSKMYL